MYSYYSKNAEAYICAVKVKAYISSFKILVALAYTLIMRKICNAVFQKNKKKELLDYKNQQNKMPTGHFA